MIKTNKKSNHTPYKSNSNYITMMINTNRNIDVKTLKFQRVARFS